MNDKPEGNYRLSFDVARCTPPDNCPFAKYCLRFLSPGREVYQSRTQFPGGIDCVGFIPSAEF